MIRKKLHLQVLRQEFVTAWSCLPEKTRGDLLKFIRQVREVVQLEGSLIGCPDGTRFGPIGQGEGFTFLYKDDSITFCDILLDSSLDKKPRGHAIATILHELAHARDYFVSPEKMVNLSSFTADIGACDQAICWAIEGISDPQLSMEIDFWTLHAKIQYQTGELAELAGTIRKKRDA